MHLFDDTVNQLHKQPGRCGTDRLRLFVSARPLGSAEHIDVCCVAIANEQIDVVESDLGMT